MSSKNREETRWSVNVKFDSEELIECEIRELEKIGEDVFRVLGMDEKHLGILIARLVKLHSTKNNRELWGRPERLALFSKALGLINALREIPEARGLAIELEDILDLAFRKDLFVDICGPLRPSYRNTKSLELSEDDLKRFGLEKPKPSPKIAEGDRD